MKRVIKGIFICLLAIFLMSHNVSAVNITHDVAYNAIETQALYYHYYNPSTSSWSNWTNYTTWATQNIRTSQFELRNHLNGNIQYLNPGMFLTVPMRLVFKVIGSSTYSTPDNNTGYWSVSDANVNCPIIDIDETSIAGRDGNNSSSGRVDVTLFITCKYLGNGAPRINLWTESISNNNYNYGFTFPAGYSIWYYTNEDYTDDIASVKGAVDQMKEVFKPKLDAINDKLDDLVEQQQREETETQNAADNSQTSGDSSQSASQGATSNLLSVFTGFANVITNASATNCVINAPLNTHFGNDALNVDLCALSLPPPIGALTSIIAVMVIVPFAISMFNKFIGIMQGFQR